MQSLLNNLESCISNWEITTQYFKLKKEARQGDLISAYMLVLVSEAVFWVIKSNKNTKDLNILNHEFLFTAYADNAILFLKDKNSVFETLNIFHKFSLVSV